MERWFLWPQLVAVLSLAVGCGQTTVKTNIPYDDRFGEQTQLDLHLPISSNGPRPAVMLIHGGGWHTGSKEQLSGLANRLAHEGYGAATINYRLGSQGAYPRAVQDCRCALAFLQSHAAEFNLAPDKIAVLGHSAGGHLASLISVARDFAATVPDCAAGDVAPPAAVIAASAPQDMTKLAWAQDVQNFLVSSVAEAPERYAEASPLAQVGPGKPPFLLIHGTADAFVPFEHATRMRDALAAEGNDAHLLLLRGGGHVLNPGTSADTLSWEEYALDSPEARVAMLDFLKRTLGPL